MRIQSLSFILGLIGLCAGSAAFLQLGDDSDGQQRSYYSNGNVKESAAYLEYERHGACRRWYEDGKLRSQGEFEHGKRVGEWTCWTAEGEVDDELSGYYVDGRLSAR